MIEKKTEQQKKQHYSRMKKKKIPLQTYMYKELVQMSCAL